MVEGLRHPRYDRLALPRGGKPDDIASRTDLAEVLSHSDDRFAARRFTGQAGVP